MAWKIKDSRARRVRGIGWKTSTTIQARKDAGFNQGGQ